MRVVLDTNALVRAITRPDGPARQLLLNLLDGPHVLITSPFLLSELQRVLEYPRIREQIAVADADVRSLVTAISDVSELIDFVGGADEISTDPDDNPIIQAAVAGNADMLCSRDRHLQQAAVIAYCAARGIRVVGDVAFLNELRAVDPPII